MHKYPNWSQEIKNIIDVYQDKKIIFTASSEFDLKMSKYDLSRRVVYYKLKGLSFREYLLFSDIKEFPALTLKNIIENHADVTKQLTKISILKYFREYLSIGYYPFYLEGKDLYVSKLLNTVEKVLYEDIATTKNIRPATITVMKKLLWLIATSSSFIPNIDSISRNLAVSRLLVYDCLEHLAQAGLTINLHNDASGMKLVKKPEKIMLANTNLSKAIAGSLMLESKIGNEREIFFVNQLLDQHSVTTAEKGDFKINQEYLFEIGGPEKKQHR